jgi:putative transposase
MKLIKELQIENARRRKLLSPERPRHAVGALQSRFGVSERRACAVVSQQGSTKRCAPRPIPDAEAKVRCRLRQIAKAHPLWGWKKAHEICLPP